MDWETILLDNWHVKVVSIVLIWAAWIDGRELRVPNWMTFPMVATGLVFNVYMAGWMGLGDGLLGMVAGLMTLLPLYAVGGMGAGDVKLMAGIGAWLGWKITLYAFAVSVIVGALMAIVMILFSKQTKKHFATFLVILTEWMTVKSPEKLSKIAAERKPTMTLLPYGIPICIGSIAYFCYAGLIY